MIFAISILIGAISLGAIYFSKLWCWMTLILCALLLLIPLSGLKARKKDLRSRKLSEAANVMLEKYGHYYSMPLAARDFGRAAMALHASGTIAAIIDLFTGYWTGVVIGVVYFIAMGMLAHAFDPNIFSHDPQEKAVHDEIRAFLEKSADDRVGKGAAKRKV
ncbi:MAG: hypothetical protein HKL98_04655 [Burkholderiales bacterium]|nr:hypothetical protein [Burkholderiales bacterium]